MKRKRKTARRQLRCNEKDERNDEGKPHESQLRCNERDEGRKAARIAAVLLRKERNELDGKPHEGS